MSYFVNNGRWTVPLFKGMIWADMSEMTFIIMTFIHIFFDQLIPTAIAQLFGDAHQCRAGGLGRVRDLLHRQVLKIGPLFQHKGPHYRTGILVIRCHNFQFLGYQHITPRWPMCEARVIWTWICTTLHQTAVFLFAISIPQTACKGKYFL